MFFLPPFLKLHNEKKRKSSLRRGGGLKKNSGEKKSLQLYFSFIRGANSGNVNQSMRDISGQRVFTDLCPQTHIKLRANGPVLLMSGETGPFNRLSRRVWAPPHTTPIRADEVANFRESSICFLSAAVVLDLLPTFPSCSAAEAKLPITEPHGPLLSVYIVTLQTSQTLSHTHTHTRAKKKKKRVGDAVSQISNS